jgi:hypothetical protein
MLSFELNMDFCLTCPKTNHPNFRQADYVLINDILGSVDWNFELNDLDVDSQLDILENFIRNTIEVFIPLSKKKPSNSIPCWTNKEVRLLVNKKNKTYARFRQFPTPANLVAFKQARNSAVNGIRQARKLYEKNLILKSKNQPKLLFSYINNNKTTTTASCLRFPDGKILLEEKNIVAAFNDFFASTLKPSDLPPPTPVCQQGKVNFNAKDVEAALLSSKEDKSWGPDGISPIFLKNCANVLATPLFIIFSNSIHSCRFPSAWKLANITPVHKGGTTHDVANYRPISLLSTVSKILEHFIHTELLINCNDLKILPKSQHGFLKGRSCLTNLLTTYDSITRLVDEGIPCDVIFLDFRKAFDSVSHGKLINKLTSMNFPLPMVSWIHSYLYARQQRVCLRGHFSNWTPVTSGVPQGSILGPLLFNIFLSDLPNIIVSKNSSYADDFKVHSPSYLSTRLQMDLDNINDWSKENALELNPSKCVVMYFGHNNPRNTYHIGPNVITAKSSHPDLGILVDDSLKFHLHAESVISKAIRKAHLVLKSFCYVNAKLFSVLMKTFIRPVLEYCAQVARPCYSSYLSRLESCQRRLTRWCQPLRHLSYQERLFRLNLPTVELRLIRGDMIMLYQIFNHLIDVNPSDFFCFATNQTRGHDFKLLGSVSHLNVRHRFFTERVIPLWNSLPDDVVSSPSLNSFKARLDGFL